MLLEAAAAVVLRFYQIMNFFFIVRRP